jgi:bifunctional UDP-N-acetylglucosamine pyrophosphorylase/glucosamine-1-phosphate N-acetyltransferase
MNAMTRTCLSIVLAAGEGTRMRSSRPKVLHAIGGAPLIAHVLNAVHGLGSATAVVVGPDAGALTAAVGELMPQADIVVQHQRRGTADAVLAAKAAIARGYDDILVLFADTPLVRTDTLSSLREPLREGAAVVVLGFAAADPTGYGRLIVDGPQLLAIREDKDATAQERAINLCNGGLMALRGDVALTILNRIGNNNAKGEFYLTDAVAIAREMGLQAIALKTSEEEVHGVNTQAQLAEAEAILQARLRRAALDAGVTMVAPDTVHLSADTKLSRDVIIEPYVVFGPGVVVEEGARIRSFSHLEGALVGQGASVGPFARLRPGARLGARARIGNFVEVKEAEVAAGATANHLTYIGDARVGEDANVGAGTITCNYDGFEKHRTDIGAGAFIGSNSSLVAPVKIGAGAYVAAGSVITEDVPADALAIGRGRQVAKAGWAAQFRAPRAGLKKKKQAAHHKR